MMFDIRSFGAQGDGVSADSAAIQSAIRACHAAGGGTVYAPPGVYLCTPFELLSNVGLYLEAGTVIRGSTSLDDYPVEPQSQSRESERAGLLTARGATNITLSGRGMIDGSGLSFVDPQTIKPGRDWDARYVRQGERFMDPAAGTEESSLAHGERPGNLIRFIDCERVRIEGVTICNSPTWTVHLHGCRNVDVDGVWIHSHGSHRRVPNDDGIDISECVGVRIRGCQIETGDDCIAVFGGANIVATGCTLTSKSAGIRIGYTGGEIRNCVFSDLVIHEAHRGIGVYVRGENSVENLLFANIVMTTRHVTGHWWGAAEPIHVSAVPLQSGARLGQVRNLTFRNIQAESESGIVLYGCPESPLQALTIEGLRLRIRKGALQEAYGGNIDLRGTADKATSLFRRDIPAILCVHMDGLRLRDIDIEWDNNLPAFFTQGIEYRNCRNVRMDDLRDSGR